MIDLTDTSYDFDEINPHIIGAGVIPVRVDEYDQIKVLLGRERYVNHWKGSLKWSGFEGGRKANEAIEETAAREFVEESMGTIRFEEDDEPTIQSVKQRLLNREYVCRIVLCIHHGDHREPRYHVTYIMQTCSRHDCVSEFAVRRKIMGDLASQVTRLNELHITLSNKKSIAYPGNVLESECVDVIQGVSCTGKEMKIIFGLSGSKETMTMCCSDHEIVALYLEWFHLRNTIEARMCEVADIDRTCCEFVRSTDGAILTGKVNEDFLEKQTTRWWSLRELNTVLENGGYVQNDFFRAYFLPVMQRTLTELTHLQRWMDAQELAPRHVNIDALASTLTESVAQIKLDEP